MSDPEHHDGGPRETVLELVARLRREPPRRGEPPYKTLAEISAEQGVGPIDIEELKKLRSNLAEPFWEGFEEDIRRMRRGLPPLGPRE